jgi:hypothetical protein
MYKIILPFYLLCFGLYIFFARQPDYTDGEFTTGSIHFIEDGSDKPLAMAIFSVDKTLYAVKAAYPLRHLTEGEKISIIYEASDPKQAAVYKWWGYWLKWNELIASILIPFILFYIAKAITSNPTPEALIEELEMDKPVKRRKYD